VDHGGQGVEKHADFIGDLAADCVFTRKRCLFIFDGCESTAFAEAVQTTASGYLQPG
jgi:hypothetical protein